MVGAIRIEKSTLQDNIANSYRSDVGNIGVNNVKYNKELNNNISNSNNLPKKIWKSNGYYYSGSMKISEAYYNKLWTMGKPAPFIQAREIINNNPLIKLDPMGKPNFYRYESNNMEMIYNPNTKEIWHIQPMKK